MDPAGIKFVPQLFVTTMVFIASLWFLTCVLFRDGDDSTRSAQDFAEKMSSPMSRATLPFNRFYLMLMLSFVAAAFTYRTLPKLAPAIFHPIPTNTQYHR